MLCLLIGGGGQVKAQNAKEISGTVTDSRGEVVISGTVKVKDSMTATMTDINGKYKISAPANGVLVFSIEHSVFTACCMLEWICDAENRE